MGKKNSTHKLKKSKVPCLDNFAWHDLVCRSTNTAMRFCAPIYLVGSALTHKEPLDLDIIMVVPEKQFTKLMGGSKQKYDRAWQLQAVNRSPEWRRYARFIKKQRDYFYSYTHVYDIDFKIQEEVAFKKTKGKKLRLDQLNWDKK